MKKQISIFITIFALLLVICVSLSGCQSAKSSYQKGVEAMNNSEWDAAIELFEDIDYEDSADLLKECIKEKGMNEKADYKYLDKLTEDIKKRYEKSENGSTWESLVSTELEMLEPFKDEEFYDSNLKALADKYLDGVYKQKEALSLSYSEFQIAWQEGTVERFQALKELTDTYGFLKNDVDYKANYYNLVEDREKELDAYKAIDEDLQNQFDDVVSDYVDDYTQRLTYTNNSGYNFNLTVYFTFYNGKKENIDTSTEYYNNIKADETAHFDFYIPMDAETFEFFWEIELNN